MTLSQTCYGNLQIDLHAADSDRQPQSSLCETADGSVVVAAGDSSPAALLPALQAWFDQRPANREVVLRTQARGIAAALISGGIAVAGSQEELVTVKRGMLRQCADNFLPPPRQQTFPLHYVVSDGKRHPLRPPLPTGELYRRYLPGQELRVSFRSVDPDADLDTFHAWHNEPRVSAFWELAGSKAMHREYLDKVTNDPHMQPVFGCFDGEPFGYFEIYWAKEDRIAPYYPADDYDRGVHMLVGEQRWRGPHRVAAWLPSLVHFMFLDDPRTRNVVAEPRADNAKMIGYMQQAGFCRLKEFDFPHKRAAMMLLSREVFFEQFCI